jgi:hypothetical protein
MNPLKQLTYVGDSEIHGQGLFARVDIPGDMVIGTLKGRRCKREGAYVLWLSETQGFEVRCNLRYINHADTPNACYYDDLSVVALRDIKPGEEITHDYESSEW